MFLTLAASAAHRAHGLRSTLRVVRSLCVAVVLVAAPAVASAQGGTSMAPVRYTSIDNQASAAYLHDGIPDTSLAGAMIVAGRQAGLSLTGTTTASLTAGQRRVMPHQLTNRGTDADIVQLAATSSAGWPVALYQDVDANGRLSAADVRLGASVALPFGGSMALLAVVDAPATASAGDLNDVRITATSVADRLASIFTDDHLTVVARATANMTLAKSVSRSAVTTGDTLRYTLAFANTGDADAHNVLIADTLPAGLQVLPGSLRLDGVALTDSADADAGSLSTLASGRALVRVVVDTIAPTIASTLTIDAVVAKSAVTGLVANVAMLSHGDTNRVFTVSGATAAATQVTLASLALGERIVGTPILTVGSQVLLRLTYGNTSTVDARNSVLIDTLPIELVVVSAGAATVSPATDAAGKRIPQIVTWSLGTLAPGATASKDITARVDLRTNGADITDQAFVGADNAATRFARVSANVALFTATDLKITKTAGVIEAAVGDAVPFTVVVKNVGVATLRGVVIQDILPNGMRFMPRSVTGADSSTVDGQTITIYLNTTLAPDASATVHYAAVIASSVGRSLENRAMVRAENGLVYSDTARAVVSQRLTLAMRERTMIGKVWLDRDGDGLQGAGEEGVAGVQVWDTNGDVSLTDKEGRFSFRNVATGTHGLRLDPIGIPKNFVLPTRADELIVVKADGWSLPSVNIRLVPRIGAPVASCSCSKEQLAASAVPVATLGSNASASASPAVAPIAAAASAAAVPALTVAPLLSAETRAAFARRELITGAGMHLVAPIDGVVIGTTRFFAAVRGVPDTKVALYDGAKLLRQGTLRGDGTQDFLSVELSSGPHHLRVVTLDSAAGVTGDSIAVHVSGSPNRFTLPAELPPLRRDAARPEIVRVRVLDQWGVPVATRPMITVATTGAVVDAADEDPSSVGRQLRADEQGWVAVPLRAGNASGTGELRLSAEKANSKLGLRMFASVRSLLVTGMGQVGVGSAPASFSAATVQGAITTETSVTLSYDSRRNSSPDGFFQRGYDPLGDEEMPTVGDNSSMRSIAPTTRSLSARVERGMDWVAAGDVETGSFGRTGDLGAYRRSLTGLTAQVGTGAMTWSSFGSMTQQSVERSQVRGDGSTGPYMVGGSIRSGTEVVAVEVRARDNAARVITRQPLGRTTDYQIDYTSGAVLLRLPIPSTDPAGNPVYLVASVERISGGAAHFVGGLRLDADASRLLHLGTGMFDSLTVGVSGVRDEAGAGNAFEGVVGRKTLLSSDLRFKRGGLLLGASMLRSQTADSSGTATSATARWTLPGDKLAFDGKWMSVGAGLGGTDPRLSSPLTETSFGLTEKFNEKSSLRLHRDESHFTQFGVTRATTGLTAEQEVRGRKMSQDLSLVSESGTAAGGSSALLAKVTTSVNSNVETWVGGTRSLATPVGSMSGGRPNEVGTGVTIKLPAGLKFDASHRMMQTPGDSVAFGVTTGQLKADGVLGGQIWTGFEEATSGTRDEVRAGHSALLGWNQHLSLGAGWSMSSLFERRIGLSRASLTDPERALPFAQAERDRWSASAGLGWVPTGDRARFTMNAEMQNSAGTSSSRFQLAGDAALNAGLALIVLNDWAGRHDETQAVGIQSRQDRSLLGLAVRPVSTTNFNTLTKLEWRRSVMPAGSNALAQGTARDLRMIASSDIVWSPRRNTEISTRYALRSTTSDVAGDSAQRLHVANHFAGARFDQRLVAGLHLRADGRLLAETESRTALWNAAPSLAYDVQGRLMLEAGYRFGGLRDPDFAAVGGAGAFATVGFRFTEAMLANPAAFWRERIANDR